MAALGAVSDNKNLNMASTVVDDTVVFDTVRNSQAVALYPLKIDVSPPLHPPTTLTYTPHVPPPLPPPLPLEPLLLISITTYSSSTVSEKEYNVVVKFHEKHWKEYMEVTIVKSVPFGQWRFKAIFGGSVFPGSPIAKNMTRPFSSLSCYLKIG